MAVLRPLKVVIENYPEGQTEALEAVNNPEDPSAGTRKVPFSRELWIEREDFMEDPPKKFYRLAPGREVRLRYAYFVTCRRGREGRRGRDRGAALHLRPRHAGRRRPRRTARRRRRSTGSRRRTRVPAEVRLYDHLFSRPDPGAEGDLLADINPESEDVLTGCLVETSLAAVPVGETVQFERLGYFCPDPDSRPGRPVFNRTLTLKDTWVKIQTKGQQRRIGRSVGLGNPGVLEGAAPPRLRESPVQAKPYPPTSPRVVGLRSRFAAAQSPSGWMTKLLAVDSPRTAGLTRTSPAASAIGR